AFAMTPSSPTPATSLAPADRLEALADSWQTASTAQTTRPIPTPERNALRDGLNTLADEAEAADRGGMDRALRRIALLSEVWECLDSEPGQGEAAAEVAAFCLEAMRHLARGQRSGTRNGDEGSEDWILRQSDERWSDYLSLADPTGA